MVLDALKSLTRKFRSRPASTHAIFDVQKGIDGIPRVDGAGSSQCLGSGIDYEALTAVGFGYEKIVVPLQEYNDYLEHVGYDARFPGYCEKFYRAFEDMGQPRSFLNKKLFEQFLCIKLTSPRNGDVVMDVAADQCPLSVVLKDIYDVTTSYHQDIVIPPADYLKTASITQVKCNATALPMKEESLTYMYSLNSWEHFQAPADVEFLVEAQRCLKPGGKLIIVPLYGAQTAFVATDPDVWRNKQVYDLGAQPGFRKDVPVFVQSFGQTYAQRHDASLLAAFKDVTPQLSYDIYSVSLDGETDWFYEKPFGHWDVLVATKTA